ncbi:uncharacterized protein LOC120173404 [Hibiscus syriacus]|uniref:uncharacterized protein LOC120173404 n=1 Tax=Hibiscus syriacus TaxID=106335 RepID=UPI0019206690|nr:uncharacterized protein LOC120173404 [Hibiscus syriacus]
MGNEMGNNNTSGLREEDNTVEGKPVQGFDHADDLKEPDRVVPATEDKEEVEMKTEGEKSTEDAGRKDYGKEQDHEVVASEDIHVNGKDEKEEVKGQDHLVPAAEDKKTWGNEMEPAYLELDGLASSRIEDMENDCKAQATSTILEVEEMPLKEAASTDETDAGDSLVPAGGDESTHGTKTELVFSGLDGTEYPRVDKQKHDEKEKDITIKDEAEEQSSPEEEEANGQDHLVPAAEDKSTWGNEMESASLKHDGLASPRIEYPTHNKKEQDTSTFLEVEEIPLKEDASTDEINAEARPVPAGGDGSTHGRKTGLVLGDCDGMVHPCIDKPKPNEKGEDMNINDEIVERSSQEAGSTDVMDRQGQLLALVEDKATYANETCLVSSDPEGKADLHCDNPKDHEKEEDNNMIPVDKEDSMKETGYAEKEKGQDHLFPAAEDNNARGNEAESASLEHDGLASPRIDDPTHNKKGGDGSTHGSKTGLVLGDCDGMVHPCIDKPKPDEKGEDIINDEIVERSSQEAGSTDVTDRQGQLLALVEDKATYANETCLVSSDPEGKADLHGDNPKDHEKEEDNNMIPVDKEDSMKETGYAEKEKGQDHLFPAAEDNNARGNEAESASLEHDGLASPRIEDPTHNKKEQDTSTFLEVEEIPLKEDASTDEINAEARPVPAGGDVSTHGSKTGLVLGDCDGMVHPCIDKPKPDEKGEDMNINDEIVERSSQEAGSTDVMDIQGQLFALVEDKATYANETCLVSSDPEGTADLHGDNPKDHEKEEDNNMIPVDKEDSMKETGYAEKEKGQDHLFPAAEDNNDRGNEAESASLEHDGLASPRIKDTTHNEKEQHTSTILEVEELPLKEGASTDETNMEGLLVPAGGDESSHGTETGTFLSDPLGTVDLQGDNPKEHEKEVSNTSAEPQEKPKAKDDTEGKNLTIPAAEDEDCNNIEAESASGDLVIVDDTLDNQTLEGQEQGKTELDPLAESTEADAKPSEVVEGSETQPVFSSKNLEDHEMQKESNFGEVLSGRTHDVEDENRMKEAEDEGASNSLSDQESSTSGDSVPRESVVVLEPEEHESTEIGAEQMVLQCNGPLKSKDKFIPSLTCQDQENGFVSDYSASTDPVVRVFADQSPEIEMETDEPGNDLGSMTTVMTNLPMGGGAKCIGELPTEMNSTKNDSPEPQVEVILLDETQNIQAEVSESEDKGIVLSQKGALMEDAIEKSIGKGSEEGSKADDPSEFSPQYMMNDQAQILENGHPVDASINNQKEQQKDSQQEVQLVTDSAYTFPMDQMHKEETEEKKIIEEMVGNNKDSNPIENGAPRGKNGDSYVPLTLSETKAIANGDHHNQLESVGRLSMESNSDNTTMRKSPSFDLDLRINARAEDSDQTPLLYQDKTTIDSFSSQLEVTDHGKPVADAEKSETPSLYESMAAHEKGVTLERSDSEKSKTPLLGFLKEDEEAENNNNNMLMNPIKQNNQSATKETTSSKVSVSVKAVTSGTTKGKVKRKPRASLFGTCMCCATVMN